MVQFLSNKTQINIHIRHTQKECLTHAEEATAFQQALGASADRALALLKETISDWKHQIDIKNNPKDFFFNLINKHYKICVTFWAIVRGGETILLLTFKIHHVKEICMLLLLTIWTKPRSCCIIGRTVEWSGYFGLVLCHWLNSSSQRGSMDFWCLDDLGVLWIAHMWIRSIWKGTKTTVNTSNK